MKKELLLGMILFIAGIVVGVLQLWFAIWSAPVFLKIELTLCALFALIMVVWFVRKEYQENESNKKGDQLGG